MSNFRIPYSIPSLPKESGTSLLNAFSNVEISGSGTEVSALEVNVGKSICVDHSLAVSNGSAALRLAYMTLGLRPGAKVMLPGWGFHVAANIAFSMGAQVEFVDVSSETWCADYSSVDLTSYGENDFLVLIHTLGNCSDVDLLDFKDEQRKFSIIEDSAEALFSKITNRYLGTLFDIGTFSMHAAKTITTGEGGFIVTNDKSVYEKAKLIRSHGVVGTNYYVHTLAGDNFRLSNLLAALANPQFEAKDQIVLRRKSVYKEYIQNLDSLPAECFIKPTDSAGFFPWGFGLRIKEGEFRRSSAEIRKHLLTRGIDSRPGFSSATKLPYFEPSMVVDNSTLRNSDQLSNEVILLPHYETLKATEIAEICELILENFVV